MIRTKKLNVIAAALLLSVMAMGQSAKSKGYVIVTDYLKADGRKDVSDIIQKIIDDNPNRTLFFPDGTYLISKPINTPADPRKSVSLQLSNYAVIKAADGWSHEEAMVRLGGKDPYNSIKIPGSNYYFEGGIVDGNGVATGISIDSGRETSIRNTSIKNVKVGIQINRGANSGSSDSDIHDVNIVGNEQPDCIGVVVIGYDNTLSNMRIGGVHIGVKLCSGGNSLRNIHPLYYSNGYENGEYATSCGFVDESNDNWFSFCYSDQFCTGFMSNGGHSVLTDCFCYWYSSKGGRHTIFKSNGRFNGIITNMTAGMHKGNAAEENIILDAPEEGGQGSFTNLFVSDYSVLTDNSHEKYMK
ncbi:MAG: hypothetical protein IJK96_07665 [Bacteroidales bacterium]|nr:hypothetical protein [Bacteroidales bacterium]